MSADAPSSRADTIAALPIFLLVFSALCTGTAVWFLVFDSGQWHFGAVLLAAAVGMMVIALKTLARHSEQKNRNEKNG
ncbi:MAG: hypothetical protein AAF004_12385 [Pseudomonadota bacterium]